ncbi:hypothetical protein AGMMS50233_02210 [Endomicrobiia bacterium]|nr:hypothetical protein AGMMS50233_02210 [Endomicrobiia bacterium]
MDLSKNLLKFIKKRIEQKISFFNKKRYNLFRGKDNFYRQRKNESKERFFKESNKLNKLNRIGTD